MNQSSIFPMRPIDSIIITDPSVIEFFKNSPFDPTKFLKSCIEKNEIPTKPLMTVDADEENSMPDFNKLTYDCNELINSKETLKNILKQQYKDNLRSIDNIKYSYLEKYLANNKKAIKKISFYCTTCNLAQYTSKKALAAHMRTCSKKTVESDDDYDIDPPTVSAVPVPVRSCPPNASSANAEPVRNIK